MAPLGGRFSKDQPNRRGDPHSSAVEEVFVDAQSQIVRLMRAWYIKSRLIRL